MPKASTLWPSDVTATSSTGDLQPSLPTSTEPAKAALANAIVYMKDFKGKRIIARKLNEGIATRDAATASKYTMSRDCWKEIEAVNMKYYLMMDSTMRAIKAKQAAGEELSPAEMMHLQFPAIPKPKSIPFSEYLKGRNPELYKVFGEDESQAESNAAIEANLPLTFILMFIVLLFLFKTYRKPTIILLMVPLIFIGVVFGLVVTGKMLDFFALLGVLGLIGMNIKNAIVLVDQIGIEEEKGLPRLEAIIEATKSRIVPVSMASGTTILGMLPLLLMLCSVAWLLVLWADCW